VAPQGSPSRGLAGTADSPPGWTTADYVANLPSGSLERFQADYDSVMSKLASFCAITPTTEIFEVGSGLGWFEVLCAKHGLSCSAIESNAEIRDAALEFASRQGVRIDIALGSIEDTDIGRECFDVVIATSVFEHVRDYRRGLNRIYQALRPGGVLYFHSTNRFSLRSGEYPDVPFYGWLPYSLRERIRVQRQGPDVVILSAIDFNQFTYWGLLRVFRSLGFSRVLDRIEYLEATNISHRSLTRMLSLRAAKSFAPVRLGARVFASGNYFICVK
jgi:SAM-dependent methyltransferase